MTALQFRDTMIIELKKLYPHHGFLTARVRDYQVQQCIDNKHDLHFKFRGQIMTIPFSQLQTRIVETGEPIESMYNYGQFYRLVSYQWSPTPVLSEKEEMEQFSKQVLA